MKFGQIIKREREASPSEWGPFWLNYKLLKKKIKSMTTAVKDHLPSDTTPEALSNSKSEVEFFRLMDYEIRRGAHFLSLTEGQYVLKTRTVLDGYRTTQHLLQSPRLGLDSMLTSEAAAEMWTRLMQACVSVYTELLLLTHWVVVSYCGFSKILKKHDRWTGFMTKEKYLRSVVAKHHSIRYPKLHGMLADMEALYTDIVKRVPVCPERAAAHDKVATVKDFVNSAAREFSNHTHGLTGVVQQSGSGGGSSSSAVDQAGVAGEQGADEDKSSSDNLELDVVPSPTSVRNTKTNQGDTPESEIPREGASRAEGSGKGRRVTDYRAGPVAKRRKLPGLEINCTLLMASAIAPAGHGRGEIGTLNTGMSREGKARTAEGVVVDREGATGHGGGGVDGNSQSCRVDASGGQSGLGDSVTESAAPRKREGEEAG